MSIGRIAAFLMFRLRLHAVWRLIPRPLRRALALRLTRRPGRTRRLLEPASPLIVVGMLKSATSFGWLARFVADQALACGLAVRGFDVSEAFNANQGAAPAAPAPSAAELAGPATLVVVLTPDQFGYGLSFLPREAMADKYVIAYSPWELESLPNEWLEPLALVDEVWAPTTFVEAAFRRSMPQLKTRVVPCLSPLSHRPDKRRDRWGLPDDAFVVLSIFSLRSGLERKNPQAAIAAFREAFPGRENAVLMLKVSDSALETGAWSELQAAMGDDPRIRAVTEHLSDGDIWNLIAASDAVISLHRAEGFGLVPAQAMMVGRPVVLTGWSATTDFTDASCAMPVSYDLVPVNDPSGRFPSGARWADAHVGEAARALRQLADDAAFRNELGDRARQAIDAYIARSEAQLRSYFAQAFQRGR